MRFDQTTDYQYLANEDVIVCTARCKDCGASWDVKMSPRYIILAARRDIIAMSLQIHKEAGCEPEPELLEY